MIMFFTGLNFRLTNAASCDILYMADHSISEAARILKVDRRTLQRWVRDRRIPPPTTQIVAGIRVRFWSDKDMEKLMEYKSAGYWGKGKTRDRSKKSKHRM